MASFSNAACGLFHSLCRWAKSVLFYEHWMIGVIDQPIRHALGWKTVPPIRWITSFDPKRYIADPFPWPGSADTIMCESYDMSAHRGRLVAFKINDTGIVDEMNIDLSLPGHLSFPYLFLHDGQVFLMPESAEARRLEILRWQTETGQWVSHALVFADKPVADAVLFEKDGLFWIAYTDITHHPHDNLNLAYASALSGPWTLHPANPVRKGREYCRSAGHVFAVGGRLYRPAQDCSKVYGGAVRIMEMIVCTPLVYEEREVACLAPNARDYPDGFHTINAWGDRCLVDGMRLVFSPRLLLWKIGRRFERTVAKRSG